MSRIVVAVLAILGLCSASPASEEACQNFIKDSKFDSSVLDGAWTTVYYWPIRPGSRKLVFQYQDLSAEQVTAYKNEAPSTNFTIPWEEFKYSMTLPDEGPTDKKTIIFLEVKDTGYAKALAVPESVKDLKSPKGHLSVVNFAYKQVGEYLAMKFCDDSVEDGYLLHKGTEHDAADVERVASSIASTISSKQGGLATFLQPEMSDARVI